MTLHDYLSELERVEKAATPGPWTHERISWEDGDFTYEINDKHQLVVFAENNFKNPLKAKFNADFYCQSRNALQKLLAIIKVQQEALERYENTKLYVRSGQCVVQRKNGSGEWITTVPIDAEESWCVGDHANEALAAVAKIVGGE